MVEGVEATNVTLASAGILAYPSIAVRNSWFVSVSAAQSAIAIIFFMKKFYKL
jgi:hypothetical protein